MHRKETASGAGPHRWLTGAAAVAVILGVTATIQTAPAQEKTVTVVLSEEPNGLDPCNANQSNIGRVMRQNISETFTITDPKDGSIRPRLATSWSKVNDHTWRFELRQGVKFHDGADFNAEAAKRAIARTMETDLDCETRTRSFGDLKITSKVVGPHTLDVIADRPVPILPTRMSIVAIASPNTPYDKLVLDPVGTGPYRLDSWKHGEELITKRFDGYWGEKPEVEGARYVFRGESTVRASMVKIGEADIAPNIAVQDATEPDMDFSYPNSETARLRIDVTKAPLNDKRIRLALNYAFDRDALRGSILSKDVEHATQIVASSINGHNPNLKVREYDPAKAQALIAEAKADGVPVDKEILMIGRTGIYPNAAEAMEAIMAMFQAVGLNVKLQMLEVGAWLRYLNKPYDENWPPMLLQAMHDNNNGDAVFSVYNKFACGGLNSTVCNKDLDELIAKASILSGPERRKTWQEVNRIIYEDIVSDVWMYHMVGYSRVGDRINFVPSIATNSELLLEDITFK